MGANVDNKTWNIMHEVGLQDAMVDARSIRFLMQTCCSCCTVYTQKSVAEKLLINARNVLAQTCNMVIASRAFLPDCE